MSKKRVENEPKFCGLLNFKNIEITKQLHVKFWFNRKNMELSCTLLSCKNRNATSENISALYVWTSDVQYEATVKTGRPFKNGHCNLRYNSKLT